MAKETWTIMLYMAGDNNLSADMAYALDSLKSAANDLNVNIGDTVKLLAFFDGGELTMPTFYFDLTNPAKPKRVIAVDTKRPYQTELKAKKKRKRRESDVEEPDLDINSATAHGIMDFVDWCVNQEKNKSDNYALIFSGHSFGFHGKSFLRDERSQSYMTTSKFKWALTQIKGEKLLNQKIGILGFDSCVMSMLEMAYEFHDVADYLVASEGSIPNAGWSYGNIIRKLNGKENTVDAATIAKKLVESYVERHTYIEGDAKSSMGGNSIDVSAWDLSKVSELATAVSELGKIFYQKLNLFSREGKLEEADIVVYEQLTRTILQSHWNCQTYMHNQCIDLKDFCSQMMTELSCLARQIITIFPNAIKGDNPVRDNFWRQIGEIRQACKNVIDAIDNCVLLCGFSGIDYQFSNGVSLFFPWTEVSFWITKESYGNLAFTSEEVGKNWHDFLAFYVCLATKRPPRENGIKNDKFFAEFASIPNLTRDNLPLKKDNLPLKKDNLPLKKGEGEGYLDYFGRMKNFPVQWDVSGYAKKTETDEEYPCETFEWLKGKK